QPGHPTLAEYLDRKSGRYQWVATPPYIDLWEVSERIDVPDDRRALVEPLKILGVELTFLANDLGSIERDADRPNYVRYVAAESRGSLAEAIERTSADYAQRVAEFVEIWRRLPEVGNEGDALGHYADMVAHVTDGNLEATQLLARGGQPGR